MFARVKVILTEKDSAQLIPSKAIVNRGEENGVFVVGNKDNATVALYFPVKIGIMAPEKTEILSPKIEGMVVTLGQHLLEEGSPIILPRKSDEAKSKQFKGNSRPPSGKEKVQ